MSIYIYIERERERVREREREREGERGEIVYIHTLEATQERNLKQTTKNVYTQCKEVTCMC